MIGLNDDQTLHQAMKRNMQLVPLETVDQLEWMYGLGNQFEFVPASLAILENFGDASLT